MKAKPLDDKTKATIAEIDGFDEPSRKIEKENDIVESIETLFDADDDNILDFLEGKSPEDIIADDLKREADEKAKRDKIAALKQATDDSCQLTVDVLMDTYPKLVHRSSHWSLTLVSILSKIDYQPVLSTLANQKKITDDPKRPMDMLRLVQYHLSFACLEHIMDATQKWVKKHPGYEVADEVEIKANSYSAPTSFPLDEKAESSADPSFGSW